MPEQLASSRKISNSTAPARRSVVGRKSLVQHEIEKLDIKQRIKMFEHLSKQNKSY
jgi:hypothetical protein